MEILSQDNGNYGTYTANCHCGHLRYEVKLSPPIPEQAIVSCNCSICSRNGYLLAYAPRKNVRFLRGGNDVAKYSFNRHLAKHAFCPKCGSSAYVENDEVKDLIAVNVISIPRALHPLALSIAYSPA